MKIIHAKQTPWGWLVSGLLVFALLLSACANITAQVAQVEPVIEETGYEKFDLKNCEEALEDLHVPVTEYFNVKQEVTVADQATAAATGASYPLSSAEKKALAAQIEAAYQKDYAAAQEALEQQEFMVPRDRAANFSITWEAKVYKACLDLDVKGETHQVEYTYMLTVPVVGDREIAICGG